VVLCGYAPPLCLENATSMLFMMHPNPNPDPNPDTNPATNPDLNPDPNPNPNSQGRRWRRGRTSASRAPASWATPTPSCGTRCCASASGASWPSWQVIILFHHDQSIRSLTILSNIADDETFLFELHQALNISTLLPVPFHSVFSLGLMASAGLAASFLHFCTVFSSISCIT